MKDSLKNLKSIGPLLKDLLKNQYSYRYKRSYLITLFSLEVLKRIDWFSKNQIKENFDKLAFASFLHDLLLKDDELVKIHSKVDLYKAKLPEEKKELVLNHANMISSIIQKYPNAPSHVDIILKQHHGTTNGVGFAENLSSSLAKLSIIFIVIEKFVIRVLHFEKDKDTMIQIIDDLNYEFSIPSYKKVMDCVKETIFKMVKSK